KGSGGSGSPGGPGGAGGAGARRAAATKAMRSRCSQTVWVAGGGAEPRPFGHSTVGSSPICGMGPPAPRRPQPRRRPEKCAPHTIHTLCEQRILSKPWGGCGRSGHAVIRHHGQRRVRPRSVRAPDTCGTARPAPDTGGTSREVVNEMGHPVLSLYEYHVWANEKVFDHLRTLPEGVYDRQLTSVFPSVAETLGHVYVVDSLWLSTMQGDTTEETFAVIQKARGEVQGAGLDRMRELFAAEAAEYRPFLRQQDDLDRPVVPHHPRYGPL